MRKRLRRLEKAETRKGKGVRVEEEDEEDSDNDADKPTILEKDEKEFAREIAGDQRFTQFFDNSALALDPSNPSFKKNKFSQALVNEQVKRSTKKKNALFHS